MSIYNIEYSADKSMNRLMVAERSQQKFYEAEHRRLVSEDLTIKRLLALEYDVEKHKELEKKYEENGREIEKLNAGMKKSNLRSGLGKDIDNFSAGVSESRLMTMPSSPVIAGTRTDKLQTKGQVVKLYGTAAPYNSITSIGPWFQEKIMYGAFTKVLLSKPDTRFLKNHDANFIYGRTRNNSLRLYNSEQGLTFWNDLIPSDSASEDLVARISRRDISGMSFGFTVARDMWKYDEFGALSLRVILEIGELFDISAVTFPAYESTNVEVTDRTVVFENPDRAAAVQKDVDEFEEWEFQQFLESERLQKKHIDEGYRHATRIINRLASKGVRV